MKIDRQPLCSESAFQREVGAQEHGKGTVFKVWQVEEKESMFLTSYQPCLTAHLLPSPAQPRTQLLWERRGEKRLEQWQQVIPGIGVLTFRSQTPLRLSFLFVPCPSRPGGQAD